MKNLIVFSVIYVFSMHAFAQIEKDIDTNFWDSPEAYFGQTPPNEIPEIFAPKMLIDSGIVLGTVSFSKDGKSFYYTYARHWFDSKGTGVKQITFDGGKWNKPKVLLEDLANPTLSTNGNTLFLGGPGSTVWRSELIGGKWAKPAIWLDKRYGLYNFQQTISGNYYAGSNANQGRKDDYSTYDFCMMTISKTDTVVNSLGIPLNTEGFNGDFYIARDESYIIVSANETPTYECELFISFRKADKTWTNPKSLGAAINDGLAHRFGQYVTPDKKYLIYTRGTGESDCNFYWVKFDSLLKRLKQSNYEPYLKTKIVDLETKSGRYFSLRIPEDTFVDDDGNNTLTYSVKLSESEKLPHDLKFSPATKTISGTPQAKGEYQITVKATDPSSASAECTFSLDVK
jgi:Putative Ig domain